MILPLPQRALATEVVLHDCQALDDHRQVEDVVTGTHVDVTHRPQGRRRTDDESTQLRVLGFKLGDASIEVVGLCPEGVVLVGELVHDAVWVCGGNVREHLILKGVVDIGELVVGRS